MLRILKILFVNLCLLSSSLAWAELSVPVYVVTGPTAGTLVGTILLSNTKYGVLFTPDLHDLPPGIHGFHVHENPSCEQNGMAAGGHFDPAHTNKHLGPYNDKGHLGDLPALFVTTEGNATLPVLAPRITHIDELKNHALMLHEGGDNYSDQPLKLGGGGTRMVCGIIK